jgi:hypothetical protein
MMAVIAAIPPGVAPTGREMNVGDGGTAVVCSGRAFRVLLLPRCRAERPLARGRRAAVLVIVDGRAAGAHVTQVYAFGDHEAAIAHHYT